MKPLSDLAYTRLSALVPGVTFYVGSAAPTSAEESGDSFVALKDGAEFARASMFGTVEARTLVLNIYAAPSPGNDDADAIALEIFSRIDPVLNNVTATDWPDIVVCSRESSEMIRVPDGDGSVLLSNRYSVKTW